MATRPGRPKLGNVAVTLQLPEGLPERIDELVGKQKRSEFVRSVLEPAVNAAEMAVSHTKKAE